MAAMKPRTGDGPLEVTKEGRGIVLRMPLEGGGRLVVEMTPDEHPGGIESYGRSYCFPVQYLQWTFAAPAGHPALGRVLQRIAAFVHDTPDRALRAWSDASPKFTLEMTGPIMLTRSRPPRSR